MAGSTVPGPARHQKHPADVRPGPSGKHKGSGQGAATVRRVSSAAPGPNKALGIVVVYDSKTSQGTLYALGEHGSVLLKTDVVVGGDGHTTPAGQFHASRWEKDHVSTKYGSYANTPWSKSPLGLNAFGPYQLHIRELEKQGIYIHGTMGPGWNRFTTLNSLVSPTSHGCVRMSNADNIHLHDLLPNPQGTPVKISTNPGDAPKVQP